jgi:methyl-accepting chemotaxis protein
MFAFLKQWSIRRKFMVASALGIFMLVAVIAVVVAGMAKAEVETKLQEFSQNELNSLRALIVNVMAKRPEDGDNIGITVFNNWFKSRNADYPGEVWSTWSDKVAAHMRDSGETNIKVARDPIDEEALRTGKPIGRFVNGSYRYSLPIVLGVTEGADQDVCYTCHGGMGLNKGDVIAVLSSRLSTAQDDSRLNRVILWIAGGGVVVTILAVLAIFGALGRIVSQPINLMIGVMARLAKGDFHLQVPGTDRGDEIGDIARAILVFRDNAEVKANMEAAAAREVQAREERMRCIEGLLDGLDGLITKVVSSIEAAAVEAENTARHMERAVGDVGQRATGVAAAAEEASVNVKTVAESSGMLTESIRHIRSQAEASRMVAGAAAAKVTDSNQRVSGLVQSANEIGDVVNMISDIAGQTNLLALNATIESARAGAAGKGFAVVAGEVKHLANQTMEATKTISEQIAAVQGETNQTVTAIDGITKVITEIEQAVDQITDAVLNQDEATREISMAIGQAASGAQDVSANIAEISVAIASLDGDARSLTAVASALKSQSASLRVEVGQFLDGIRKA